MVVDLLCLPFTIGVGITKGGEVNTLTYRQLSALFEKEKTTRQKKKKVEIKDPNKKKRFT